MVCNIYEKWCVPFSFLCYTKHSVDLKGETNNMERRNAWKIYTADQLKELNQINSRYKVCLDEGKTERECIRLTVKEIEKQGPFSSGSFPIWNIAILFSIHTA